VDAQLAVKLSWRLDPLVRPPDEKVTRIQDEVNVFICCGTRIGGPENSHGDAPHIRDVDGQIVKPEPRSIIGNHADRPSAQMPQKGAQVTKRARFRDVWP